jgi:chemotaxis signal transduction protein
VSRGARGPRRVEQVDWLQVHARIEHLARELAGAGERSPEAEQALLAERARLLARRGGAAEAAPSTEVVRFALGGRVAAIAARWVVEAVRESTPTPLPGAAPPVRALVPWRGRILTALDLRDALGAPAGAEPRRLLVLGDARAELALLVDEILGLDTIADARVHPLPDGAAGRQYALGLADDATLLLDGAAVLRLHPADA